ncbi:acetyl/propionyl/methylcrotonyl-CoA carboxylase subunit alpha [Geminicoccus flavidas]|uniref:acetyl/propionyl/methylcrotonyl-CoA carboxylase subunit alpha n=1 Tax=Geminicoccus flavidas TaxID=2506407 RepID=UPI0013570910|nr:biotin carboxylase N-terminal domain-containing protein [Geminicoccus flavidas]
MRKLLVANRGEIACRIFRTAAAMGIRTVAVFGTPDRDARHVALANEAIDLGGESAAETYLSIDRLLAAARRSGADAIHPGYGFLSESPAFAEAVAAAGLTFVGPSAAAMAMLGSKAAARRLAASLSIPVLPGDDGADQARLAEAAQRIGFPLLVKAAAGGGGRGMRVVQGMNGLAELLASARAEAEAAFGDGTLILERLVERPRHVEVQVLADRHGRVLALGERDCTLQRRHQKVIEEAPASFLDQATRAALGEAAVRLVAATDYAGAATVEFLLDPEGGWHLIEVNTRLQVEHPVTELVTGLDLVAWQLRIASGETLPAERPSCTGHAVELRICAEDPAHGLRPTTGRISRLDLPADARVDHGLLEGMTVGAEFDSLLAKLIVHGQDRDDALAKASAALAALRIEGIVTNIPLLARILRDPEFRAQRIDPLWLERTLPALVQEPEATPEDLAIAAAAKVAARPPRPADPWFQDTPWRMNLQAEETVRFAAGPVRVLHLPGGFAAQVDGQTHRFRLSWTEHPDEVAIEVDGHRRRVVLRNEPESVLLVDRGVRLRLEDAAGSVSETVDESAIRAPLPGRVAQLCAEVGMEVEKGQLLVVLDAMKMEHRLLAPCCGRVVAVAVAEGDRAVAGQMLVELAP